MTHLIYVADLGGTLATLTPTTDSSGHQIMVTAGHHEDLAKTTAHGHGSLTKALSATTHGRPNLNTQSTNAPSSRISHSNVHKPPVPASDMTTLTRTVAIVKVTTVTSTVTKIAEAHGAPNPNRFTQTKTVVNVNKTMIPMTGSTQLYHSGTLLVIPLQPQATLHPLSYDPLGVFDLMDGSEYDEMSTMDMDELRERYSHLSWHNVETMAALLRARHDFLELAMSIKYAIMLMLQSYDRRNGYYGGDYRTGPVVTVVDLGDAFVTVTGSTKIRHNKTTVTIDPATMTASTVTVADLSSTIVTITQPTQTLPGGSVMVVDPTPTPQYHDIYDEDMRTPSCKDGGDWKQCEYERCMWDYRKPINITTVFLAAMADPYDHSKPVLGYFTQQTSISGRPHWGTTKKNAVYWPLRTASTLSEGIPSTTVTRDIPTTASKHKDKDIEREPHCWDEETCHRRCKTLPDHSLYVIKKSRSVLLIVCTAVAGFIILLCLILCCLCCFRRRNSKKQRDPQRGRKDSGPASTVITEATLDPATGRVVDPATGGTPAVIVTSATDSSGAGGGAGDSASGAAGHGNEKSGGAGGAAATGTDARAAEGDGRGTLSRRAEEGRGRVHFGEAQGGGGTGEKVVQQGSQDPGTEHVETVPAHQVDGAGGRRTGSEVFDMGSVRGRKRARPNLQDVL